MKITETRAPGYLVITLNGRLDSATAPLLGPRLDALINEGETTFIVDCADLHYLSSAGLRTLLQATRQLGTKGGRITLAAPRPHVLEVIELSGMTSVLPNFADLEAAIAALPPAS